MKRFIVKLRNIIVFFALFLVVLEIYYSVLENDYCFKASRINRSAVNIESVILGNSHSYFGLNPKYFTAKTFNLSHVSQTYDLDDFLLDKVLENQNIKTVIIPVSYSSFCGSLKTSSEAWRITDYYRAYHYYDIDWKDKFYVNTQLRGILRSLLEPLSSRRRVNNDGFATAYCDLSKLTIENAKQRINQHKMNTNLLSLPYAENEQCVALLNMINQHHELEFVLVSLPVHGLYSERRDKSQQAYISGYVQELRATFDNVKYFNMDTIKFDDTCFKDVDHLSSEGAMKASVWLNSNL